MNGRIAALAAAVLIAGASADAAVNVLVCMSFEANQGASSAAAGDVSTTGSGWSGWNNWVAPYTAFITDDVAHSGTQAGKTFSGPNAGIYQSLTATAGLTYEASAYFLNRSGDALQGATTLDVRMTFKGVGGVAIGTPFVSTPLNASLPLDTWTLASVQAVAPAGTQSVEYMVFMNNPGNNGGAMYVDDTSLTVVPEPMSLGLLALGGLGLLRRRRA